MNYKIVAFLLIIITLNSCKKETSLVFISDNLFKKYDGGCKSDDCPEVTIDYVSVIGDELVAKKINSKINDFIIASLIFDMEDSTKYNSLAEAANNFIKVYETDKKEFPEISPYFAEISVSESYSSKEMLCYETAQYLFTGGAHGYGSVSYLNIDPETGELINNKDLFVNEKEFSVYAESKFRLAMDILENEPINSTGFWFEDNTFYIPDSIGFTDDSLILIYNPYEIASYANGPIELEISLKKVLPYLTFK